ncbi:MAG: transcription termination factor Rho [Verrucomicrobia bacterium]|nr:transcription termination factor Rho [Verrucomicrobiota bacterium]
MEDSHNKEAASEKDAGTPVKKTAAKTRRPRAPRAKTVKKKAAPAEVETTQEMPFEHTPVAEERSKPAPAPERIESTPPPPLPAAESEPKRSVFEPTSSSKNDAPAAAETTAPEARADTPAQGENQAPVTQPQQQQPGQHHQHPPRHQHGQGGGGHGQGGGQGGGQEPFRKWDKHDKRNKRQRGRHGGGPGGGGAPWQQGGGQQSGGFQGGGGPAPKYPQQPPPPNLTPTYGDLPSPERLADLAALAATAVEITSGGGEPVYIDKLYALNLGELTAEANRMGVTFQGAPNRKQLVEEIFKQLAAAKRPILDRGWIDLNDKGYGFIVHEAVNYRLYPDDPYLPESLIFKYGLKRGHYVEVLVQAPKDNERCPSVVRIDQVMGLAPDEISKVKPFEDLVPYYPLSRILLEAPEIHKDISMRAVDILTPIGFGQRGLIVAPPRTGKTVLLQNMANSISENFPETKLILLLIDERPEEVTDFKRHTKGEVVSSTFDEAPESHVHCAEMVGEKARRLVEAGQHVVILLDSITRLARAYNALASNSGKIMSGGMEATALQKPKRFFGAARNIEGGGSLTIIATALIDTGSRMDEVIFEEFKGTGNMELHLDRGLVDKRIFPAINMDRSGTRKEELIYHPEEMQRIYGLRRAMQGIPPVEAMEMLITRLKKTKTNAEFLMGLSR